LSFEEKVKFIREIEYGKDEADVCREFGPVIYTIQKSWKNGTKLITERIANEAFRKPERSDVDEALHKWFKRQRKDNVPVVDFFS
jgi:hypothetical protein